MATSSEYMEFVLEQIPRDWNARYRKMFGEYMVYINDKPLLLVCDSTVFVKKLPELEIFMEGAACGIPYKGAKEHFILDIENMSLVEKVIRILEQITPLPKPKKKKAPLV